MASARSLAACALAASILVCAPPLRAEDEDKTDDEAQLFRDPQDGEFDVSNWLASRYGFLPVPVIITGPTFGAGGGINFMFLHGKLAGEKSDDGRNIPPAMTGLAAVGTENGSRAAAAYNLSFWKQDRVRSTTFIASPDINLDFYPSVAGRELEINMNIDGGAFYQELKFRVGNSNFLLGGNYTYASLNSAPVDDEGSLLDVLLSQEYQLGGLGAVLEYDSRDVIFTPTRGSYGKLVVQKNAEWMGSDSEYSNVRGKLFHYRPLSANVDLALRLEAQSVTTGAPYFVYPSVEIRGIPSKRYQGQKAFTAEAELNWRVHDRWHLVGFAGSGKAFGENLLKRETDFSEADWRSAGGVGFRYEIARKFGMQVGLDVARGPDETAYYLTVGSAWNAFY